MSTLIGYARVSTAEQKLDLQTDALTKAGCVRIFTDHASGAKSARPGLDEALAYIRSGDTIVVWRLDRFGRSLKDLIANVGALDKRGVGFRSITENIDTTTPTGRLVFHIFGALAQFELELNHERTLAGLAAARARGRRGGRKPKLTGERLQTAASLVKSKTVTIPQICEMLHIGRTTLYKYITPQGEIR